MEALGLRNRLYGTTLEGKGGQKISIKLYRILEYKDMLYLKDIQKTY
jgi:hypothetical protein